MKPISPYLAIFLLAISLLGPWRSGYDTSFFTQLTSYPDYILGTNIFISILKIVGTFGLLLLFIALRKFSNLFNILGILLATFLFLLTLLLWYLGVFWEGFPSRESSNNIFSVGFGPYLAGICLIYLGYVFGSDLMKNIRS